MLRRLTLSLGLVLGAMLLVAPPVSAQQYPFNPPVIPPQAPPTEQPVAPETPEPPEVDNETVTPVPKGEDVTPSPPDAEPAPLVVDDDVAETDAEVAGDVVTRTLPVTGGDLVGLAAIGAGAVAAGALLVSRRRNAS